MFEIQRYDHNQPQFSRESLHLEGKRRPYKFLEFINAVVYSLVVQNLFLHVHGRFCLCAAPRRINFWYRNYFTEKNRQKRVFHYYLLGFDKFFLSTGLSLCLRRNWYQVKKPLKRTQVRKNFQSPSNCLKFKKNQH